MDAYVIFVIIICFFLAFAIGAQEETMSTTLGSGSLRVKHALFIGAVLIFLGSLLLSENVGKTLGANIITDKIEYSDSMMYAVLIISIIWLIIGATTGVPISLNQTVVSCILGVILVESIFSTYNFFQIFNMGQFLLILLGWVLGPILVYLLSAFAQYVVHVTVHTRITGILDANRKESVFRWLLVAFVSLNQFSTAGNQAGNTLGMIYGLQVRGSISASVVFILALSIALLYVLGFLIFGKNLIVGLGKTMGNMRPSETLSVEFAGSLMLFITTYIGLPVSGAQILIFSLMGTKRMRGEKVDRKALTKMIKTWLALIPLSVAAAGMLYVIIR